MDYKQLYEQEKQRADRSERQWSDFKKKLIALNESKSIKGAAKASAIINLNTMLNIEMKYREDTE